MTSAPTTYRILIVPFLLVVVCVLVMMSAGCRKDAPQDLILQEETTSALVFVKTRAEETLNRTRAEGNLFKLRPIAPTGRVTALTDFTGATVADPCVSFDGKRILFSMRPPQSSVHNIYEIDADGRNLRQVTTGGGDDFDPLYLPNGQIMFTSSRAGEMDEYNFSPAEVLYTCNYNGTDITRVSFNMSDDFDPTLMPDGRIIYTRWEHFGTFNRFPLFFCNPDGCKTFHKYGPHNRNFFHAQPTDGNRIIAIESTKVNEDAGPIVFIKPEMGPADPPREDTGLNWDVLTADVNNDGSPWAYGAFKYPYPLGGHDFVVSYTLPSADEEGCDYGLYTFTTNITGLGTEESPARLSLVNMTFLYNDPNWNEYDAQLIAPRDKPEVVPSLTDPAQDSGVFLAHDVFNRTTTGDGQEVPVLGVDVIDELAVIVGIPTMRGETNDFSANTFDRRALLGFAPVYPDGSFRIRVPADLPITFSTLDTQRRAIVSKRTWIYVHGGEEVDECTGCHKDRGLPEEQITNPDPYARSQEPSDLNVAPEDYVYITYEKDIGPIVESRCATCHYSTYNTYDVTNPDGTVTSVTDTIPAPGGLDLTAVLDTTRVRQQVFPRGYLNLSGESEMNSRQVVEPAFPRRSVLIDYVLGVGEAAANGPHPDAGALSPPERELFTLWVMLGAQFR